MPDKSIPHYNYDTEGKTYAIGRRNDARIASQLWQKLNPGQSLLNIGAGAGSYEPVDTDLVALEPSTTMIRQRPEASACCVQGCAEQLPFANHSFDQVMTILSMHHWPDQATAFREIRRVCKQRFVALTWDPACEPFWLTRDYFPEIIAMDRQIFPSMDTLREYFPHVQIETVAIPWDCQDGFFAAFWRRPEAYLDPQVRACMSTFGRLENVDAQISRLAQDLSSGQWYEKNKELMNRNALDAGYRLLIIDVDDML